MILIDIISMILRVAELAFACVVAGITGDYLHKTQGVSAWDQGRFIYAEVVAGLSILLSIVWLFPFSGSFIHWPADLIISVMWWVVFALLVTFLNGTCGNVFDWQGISFNGTDTCPKWKADVAFAFLSALCWLVSAILGIYWTHRKRNTPSTTTHHTHGTNATTTRRRWYRRSRV